MTTHRAVDGLVVPIRPGPARGLAISDARVYTIDMILLTFTKLHDNILATVTKFVAKMKNQ